MYLYFLAPSFHAVYSLPLTDTRHILSLGIIPKLDTKMSSWALLSLAMLVITRRSAEPRN